MIMRANEAMIPWGEFKQLLTQLTELMVAKDCESIRKLLRQYVDGYQSQGEIVDCLYLRERELG